MLRDKVKQAIPNTPFVNNRSKLQSFAPS